MMQTPDTASAGNPKALLYLIAGLLLITGGYLWFIYSVPHRATAAPPAATPAAEKLAASAPAAALPASAPAASVLAASQVPQTTQTDAAAAKKPAARHTQAKRRSPAKQRPPVKQQAGSDPIRAGYLSLSQGRLQDAERDYQAALATNPHDKDALLGLANIAQRNRQTERAADLYRQVLREDMGNAAAAAGLVSLSVPADPVAAESQLRELIDIKPAAPELHYALGGVLAGMQRWGEAQQAFFRAYSMAPDNALYAYNLAVCLDRLHQHNAALIYYQKAADRDAGLEPGTIQRRIDELKH